MSDVVWVSEAPAVHVIYTAEFLRNVLRLPGSRRTGKSDVYDGDRSELGGNIMIIEINA